MDPAMLMTDDCIITIAQIGFGEFIVEKQTGRQTDRQIDRQTDRQTDKYVHDEKYLENVMMIVLDI